ncbi:hypothetical protein MEU_03118 [Candida albicans P37005]|nr:hypothetical protein MEU_03118 [Candida albicans P37005]
MPETEVINNSTTNNLDENNASSSITPENKITNPTDSSIIEDSNNNNNNNTSKLSLPSPSISSISSLDSNNSTEKLINSLANSSLNETKTNEKVSEDSTNKSTLIITQLDPETLSESEKRQLQRQNRIPQSFHSKTKFYDELSQASVDVVPTTTQESVAVPVQRPPEQKPIDGSEPGTTESNTFIALPKKIKKFTVRKISNPEAITSPTSSPNPSKEPLRQPKFSPTNTKFNVTPHVSPIVSYSENKSQGQSQSRKSSVNSNGDSQEHKHQQELHKLRKIEEKYDQYELRIEKIDKEIAYLKKLLPPYNVQIDYNTRVKINKAIEKLSMKKDEIDKKKYDLGITISRLWRNLGDGKEIWVRKFD